MLKQPVISRSIGLLANAMAEPLSDHMPVFPGPSYSINETRNEQLTVWQVTLKESAKFDICRIPGFGQDIQMALDKSI